MDQDSRQDVDGGVDRQSPQVGAGQEGEDVGHATPAGVQEVARQPAGEVGVPRAPQAGQAPRGKPRPVVQAQLL